jgi:hypothetical protein
MAVDDLGFSMFDSSWMGDDDDDDEEAEGENESEELLENDSE